MYSTFQFTCVSLSIWYCCYGQFLAKDVKFYEYGAHAAREQISFIYNGVIPGFKPIYTLNLTTNKELKPEFTYLRVEYFNMMSDVNVSYDPALSTLNFHVKYPFVDTPVGVLGYSLPK